MIHVTDSTLKLPQKPRVSEVGERGGPEPRVWSDYEPREPVSPLFPSTESGITVGIHRSPTGTGAVECGRYSELRPSGPYLHRSQKPPYVTTPGRHSGPRNVTDLFPSVTPSKPDL